MKHICRAAMIFTISLLLYGCSADNQNHGESLSKPKDQSMTVGDISFENDNQQGCRIYLEESNNLVPFLVLTSDYNGNCLILREYLLDDDVSYNVSGEYGSYYNGSKIDSFLNDDYYFRFSEKLQQLIVNSEIEITSKKAIDTHADDIETIRRKIFLLSANEIDSSLGYIALKEGEPLSYFKDIQNRIATFNNLEGGPWILRTPALSDRNTIFGIAPDGCIGIGGINSITGDDESTVRPAFCIPSDTPVILNNNEENTFCIK